jgi:hypothetical protein
MEPSAESRPLSPPSEMVGLLPILPRDPMGFLRGYQEAWPAEANLELPEDRPAI